MSLQDDMTLDADLSWRVQPSRSIMQACLRDAAPFLSRFQAARQYVLFSLFRAWTKTVHRNLSRLPERDIAVFRAEGVARRFLACRESLVLYNQFPVGLVQPPGTAATCAARAEALIVSVSRLIKKNKRFADLLSAARLPERHCDTLRLPLSASNFVVLRRGLIFVVTLTQIEAQGNLRRLLDEILAFDSAPVNSCPRGVIRVGELTALPREVWLPLRANASEQQGLADVLTALDDAAFVVCLDDDTTPSNIQALGHAMRVENIANRCFDKCIQLVVFANGEAGLLCDHGAMDGHDAIALAEAIVFEDREPCCPHPALSPDAHKHEKLRVLDGQAPPSWLADKHGLGYFDHCLLHYQSLSVQWHEYGQDFFAATGFPADSLIQLAIQLAFSRCMGRQPSVFEPVSLSHLPGGRLDFISPVTTYSRMFVSTFTTEAANIDLRAKRKALLIAAIQSHRKSILLAKQGLGHIGQLLAQFAFAYPTSRGRGVKQQRTLDRWLSRIDPGMAVLIQRDITASSGGSSEAIQLFGTIVVAEPMLGIGYMVKPTGLVVDIQANGGFAASAETFKQNLYGAIAEIVTVASTRLSMEGR